MRNERNNNKFASKWRKNSKNSEKNIKNRKKYGIEPQKPKYDVTKSYMVNHSIELLEFLLEKAKLSRTNAKSLLTKHQVLVNGNVISQYNFLLVKDDEVKLTKRSVKDESINPSKSIIKQKVKLPFDIIYQDDDIIAINKPAGLLSVESDNDSKCAYSYLLKYFQNISKTNRPYILHRIDKETSGVLIFAKNPIIHSMLKLHWNEDVKTREYIALVEGEMDREEGTFVSYLKQNSNNMVYSSKDNSGQRAVTHYAVLNKNKDYSLLQVLIDTGRKNQIRVHMHDIHHPIVGDEKYGYTKNPIGRLGLHASKLEFINPKTKKLVSISAPVPTCFYKVFEK